MKNRTTIRANNSGWVVYFDNDTNNFTVFKSTEPERLVKFLTENVAGIKIDDVVAARTAEIETQTRRTFGQS